jgi:hypothetical protein
MSDTEINSALIPTHNGRRGILPATGIPTRSSTLPVSDPAYQREINNVIAQAQQFAPGTRIILQSVGPDGRTTYLLVNFTKDANYIQGHLDAFRATLAGAASAGPAQLYLTGDLATTMPSISRWSFGWKKAPYSPGRFLTPQQAYRLLGLAQRTTSPCKCRQCGCQEEFIVHKATLPLTTETPLARPAAPQNQQRESTTWGTLEKAAPL